MKGVMPFNGLGDGEEGFAGGGDSILGLGGEGNEEGTSRFVKIGDAFSTGGEGGEDVVFDGDVAGRGAVDGAGEVGLAGGAAGLGGALRGEADTGEGGLGATAAGGEAGAEGGEAGALEGGER